MGSEHVLRPPEIHSIYKIIYHFIRSISRPQFFVGPVLATTFNWPHNLKTESETHLMEMNVIVITWSLEIVPTRTANLKPNLALPLFLPASPFPIGVPRFMEVHDQWMMYLLYLFFFFFFSCAMLNFSDNSFYPFSFIGLYRTNGPSWWSWTNRSRR